MASIWGTTPQQSVQHECDRIGLDAVVSKCLAILDGSDIDEAFLFVIAGPAARTVVDGREGGVTGYWPRTWALRALLYAWQDRAATAVVDATADQAWRVRETALKVIAKHNLDDAFDTIGPLLDDPNERVRKAAGRARQALTE